MKQVSARPSQALTGRKRKLLQRRDTIHEAARFAAGAPGAGDKLANFSALLDIPALPVGEPASFAAFTGEDDDLVRATRVYGAVKRENDRKPARRPFNPGNKLADPPCRFKEDSLEPFLLRVSDHLLGGSPRIAFGTEGDFESPDHKSWEAFVTAMLAANYRALVGAITRASRTVA
jgi:hypothetical protein